jgi:predicted phage tail protein
MVKVYLEGRVGKSLGKKWKLHVGTVGEAIRAIRANTGNAFTQALGVSKGYAAVVDGVPVAPDACFLKKIKKSLVLIPILAGGVVTTYFAIAGAFMMAGVTTSIAVAGFLAITVMVTVAALVMLGLSAMISNMAEDPKDPKAERTSSFIFGGAENTANQGGVVPVAYGRMRVGSMTISVSSSSVEKSIWDKAKPSNSMIFR